jgi:hypothetical protein
MIDDFAASRAALAAVHPDLVTLVDQLQMLEARVSLLELRASIARWEDAAARVVH